MSNERRYPRRLIEVDLPIKEISTHARREKSIRHGHISTLHIWWARRPLAACRAVILAALWPDPADPLCPERFRAEAAKAMNEFRDRCGGKPRDWDDPAEVRAALLDFIADFANWDNSTSAVHLDHARRLVQVAHESLGGAEGTKPLVVDPFAGGGAIPLEALRVGADAFASDLNPVAVLLNKVVLERVPKGGRNLSDEVRRWGVWVKEKAEEELARFYPKDQDGAVPIAYLWARTIRCEGPGCGVEVPLVRSLWLSRKQGRPIAMRLLPRPDARTVDVEIAERPSVSEADRGTVRRGAATCPCCNYTTPAKRVREQLTKRRGGSKDARLMCVVTTREHATGRFYRLPNLDDERALDAVRRELARRAAGVSPEQFVSTPREPTPAGKGKGAGRAFSQRNYGMTRFEDLYTDRQLLTLTTLARIIRNSVDAGLPDAVRMLCAFALGRVNDLSMTLCRWLPTIEATAAANGGQNRMPVVLDFVETNPFGGSGGDWLGQIDWVARVVQHIEASALSPGTALRAPAQSPSLPQDSAQALVTDPPYYDAFPYSDLADFFLIWLRRSLDAKDLDFEGELSPKEEEAVVYDVAHGGTEVKDRHFFQREMTKAFDAWRGVVRPSGIGVVVFANKTTAGWEALIESLIDAGWTATASWPVDTERPNRQRAIGSAALGSSVHVICRPRENADGSVQTDSVGDWRAVLRELPVRIHEWMPRLAQEGVVGADAIFACLGPALEIFSRYSRVEKASGERVELREYLEEVWAAVAREALSMIFEDADATGLEEDARLTAMWLWTLSTSVNGTNGGSMATSGDQGSEDDDEEGIGKAKPSTGFSLEFDAARKIAQGLGAHLEDLGRVVEIKGDQARLLSVAERTQHLFGKDPIQGTSSPRTKKPKQLTLFEELEAAEKDADWGDVGVPPAGETALDRVHQSMVLFAAGRAEALKRFLVEEGIGRDARFWKLAQSLSALYPGGTEEKRWVDGVLTRKKGLGFG